MMRGTLYGVGVGPGDPELLTLKAVKTIQSCPVIAYPIQENGFSFARSIVSAHLNISQTEIAIQLPMRTSRAPAQKSYDMAALEISTHLDQGADVAVLCEGDPFFYGSFMYLNARLQADYDVQIIPGISSFMAGAAALGQPLAARNDKLCVIPGPLSNEAIAQQLAGCEAAVIIKIGRHFTRIVDLLKSLNLTHKAAYLEHISLPAQKAIPLAQLEADAAPYFSLILVYKGTEEWAFAPDT